MKRRWLKRLLIICGILLFVLVGVYILLQTQPANRFILSQAQSYLREKAGIDLRASRMKLNLLKRAVTLDDVTVRSVSSPELPPLLLSSQIYARLGTLQTGRGFPEIRELRITDPQIFYFVDRDGRTNLPAAGSTSSPSPKFLIAHAELTDGSFRWEDVRHGIDLNLPIWQLSVEGNRLTLDHHLDFSTLRPSSFRYGSRITPLDSLKFVGTLKSKSLDIGSAKIVSANSQLSVTGALNNFSNPEFNLRLTPNFDLPGISRTLGIDKPVEGNLSGTLSIKGESRDLKITAQLRGSGITALTFKESSIDIKTNAEWNSRRLLFRSFEVNSPDGALNGNAELFPGKERGANSVKANLQDLNLFPIWKLLKSPFSIASRGTGKVSLRWKGSLDAAAVDADARLSLSASRAIPEKNILPLSGSIDAQLRSGRMSGTLQGVSAMGTRIDGKFTLLLFEKVDAAIQGTTANVESPLAQAARFVGQRDHSLIGIPITGAVAFDAQVSGRLSSPRISVSLQSPALAADKFKNLKLKADATVQDSNISFQGTVATQQNSIILANGILGLGGKKTTLKLDARTDAMPASAALPLMGADIPAAGNLKADIHVDGPLDSLTGNGSVTGDDFAIYQTPLGHFDVKLKIHAGEIQSDPFRVIRDSANPDTNYIDARFNYGTSSGRFQFEATGKNLTLAPWTGPGGKRLEGTLNLTASGSGTVEQPSIDVKIESQSLAFQNTSLGPLSITAALRNNVATIETLSPRENLSSTIHVSVHSPYPFDGELKIGNSDIGLLGLTAPNKQPLTGTVSATAKGTGNLKEPAESSITASIDTLDLHAGNLEAHTGGPVQAEYRDNSITFITPATVVSGNSRLQIAGQIPLRNRASSSALRLNGQIDLAQTLGFVPAPEGFAAGGIVNVDLSLQGTPKQVNTIGTIALDNGNAKVPQFPVPFSDITIRANLQDGSLVLSRGEAKLGDGRILLQGEFPFGLLPKNIPVQFPRKEGSAAFTVNLTNFKPEITGLLPQGMSGLISVRATGQASSMDIRSLQGQVVFSDLELKFNEIAIAQKGNSKIVVQDGIASISKPSDLPNEKERILLTGTETSIEATGSASLLHNGRLNLSFLGNFDAALLTLFTGKDLKITGKTQVQLAAAGTLNSPTLSGTAGLDSGTLMLRNPRVVADTLTVRVDLSPGLISIREFKGTLNGGSLTMDGTVGYQNGALNNFNLKAALQDVFLNFPEGLKSALNGNLTITSSNESIVVAGNARILESSYRESFAVTGQLLNYFRAPQIIVGSSGRSSVFDRIRFNIALRTDSPLLVQNNIAKIEADVNLRLVGSFYEPSLVGRAILNQGGEISLNQRTYYIKQGTITLVDESQIKPELDIQAQTRVDPYDITLRLTGPPEKLLTTLSSEPALQEPDIISLLLTGRTGSENTQQLARTQALSLIAGQVSEEVAAEARQALHLSTFRIDPGLIAPEADPGARLTIGKDVTRDVRLAYSMSLVNGGDQIWTAQYNITRSLTTQATKQQDNSDRFEFRHDLRFGGTPSTRRSRAAASKFTIGSIHFQNQGTTSEKILREEFKVKPGDKYEFPKVQKGLDRLHNFYYRQKRFEADIRLHRETQQGTVDLEVTIDPGPSVEFSFEGISLSSKIREKVDKAWAEGVFDTERLEEATTAIRKPLLQEGYLQAQITYEVEAAQGKKVIRFFLKPGPRYAKVPVIFPGASEISAGQLSDALNRAQLNLDVYADPQKVVDYLKRFYRERGYLQASVDLPQPHLDPKTGTGETTILVHEGPQFTIGDLEFSGNSAFNYDQLWSVIPTSTGSIYNPGSLQDSVRSLENTYHEKGYNDASITYRIIEDTKTAHANVTFLITERKQSIIRDIAVEGNQGTSQSFIRRQLAFKTGDVLDINQINETRRRLYSTGVYTSVDFRYEEIPGATPEAREKDIRVRIRLREIRPYHLQYGFYYDTERGPGGLLEAQNTDVLGRASTLGMRLRYDSDLQEARVYYNQPFVTNNFLKMDLGATILRENRPGFSANTIAFSIFREKSLSRKYVFDYGYRYDHVRWSDLPSDPTLFQASVPVARLIGTVWRDTRDSILNATRGEFTSHSIEFGPQWLGSENGFARYYGQYFRYVPLDKFLGKPTKDKEGNRIPPSLVYAGALRLGLIGTFSGNSPAVPISSSGGQTVIAPERFFAGGGTTMRGFQQDLLGPVVILPDGTQRPLGGEGLFLFNNELRFPIVSILHGVGFVDIGNVYPLLSDFNFNVRKSAGFGLRVIIKSIPLRFDYGLKLDRRPGESKGAFFFSIGQAF